DVFNLEDINLLVHFNDGTFEIVSITQNMLSFEQMELLNIVGSHLLTLNYKGFTTSLTLNLNYNALKTKLHYIYTLATTQSEFNGTYEEWLESIRGPQGEDGRKISLRLANGNIQWQYEGDINWTNLVSISYLIGDKG